MTPNLGEKKAVTMGSPSYVAMSQSSWVRDVDPAMRARVTLLGDIPVERSEDFEQEIGDHEVHKHGTGLRGV